MWVDVSSTPAFPERVLFSLVELWRLKHQKTGGPGSCLHLPLTSAPTSGGTSKERKVLTVCCLVLGHRGPSDQSPLEKQELALLDWCILHTSLDME